MIYGHMASEDGKQNFISFRNRLLFGNNVYAFGCYELIEFVEIVKPPEPKSIISINNTYDRLLIPKVNFIDGNNKYDFEDNNRWNSIKKARKKGNKRK